MSAAGPAGAHLGALSALEGMGPVRLRALLSVATPEELWEMLRSGRTAPIVTDSRDRDGARMLAAEVVSGWVRESRVTRNTPEAMQARIAHLGLAVHSGDSLPTRLREDPDPPGALFASGAIIDPLVARVAVVGTRRASDYGLRVARMLGRDLAAAGVEVVSGLALGIDAAAHAGALEPPRDAPGVIAVIGAGHDRPCPVRNRGLARAVGAAGTILSEVPPGVGSAPWRYPVRNRLIAALADVVVVVESASVGGSMSTVAEALTRDRVVMAVPGPLGRRTAQGCHDLLRDGAEICTGAADVISMLELLGHAAQPPIPTARRSGDSAEPFGVAEPLGTAEPGGDQRRSAVGAVGSADRVGDEVLEFLADGPRTLDALVVRSGMGFDRLCAVVAGLEAASLVRTEAGWVHRLA